MVSNSYSVRHLFYSSIKQIVLNRQSGRLRFGNRFELFVLAYLTLRGQLINYTYLSNFENSYWQYEYLLCFARTNPRLYDGLLVLSISMIITFYYILKMGFELSPIEIWIHLHKLIVDNMDIYYECWKSEEQITQLHQAQFLKILDKFYSHSWSLVIPNRLIRCLCMLKAKLFIWKRMDHVNLNLMRSRPLMILKREAEMKLRIRLIIAVTIIDQVCFVIQFGVYLIAFAFCWTYGPAFIQASSWYHSPIILLDLLGIFFSFPRLIQFGLVYCLCSLISNLVFGFKLKRCFQIARMTLRNARGSKARGSWSILDNFSDLYVQHTQLCAHLLWGNRKFWSKMLALFLLTNVPLNLYFITHLLFDRLPNFEKLFFMVLLVLQMSAAAFLLLRLAKNHKLIHRFHIYVPAIQQHLTGPKSILCKLKFDQLLHRLTTSKYGMTVGPLFLITYESVLKGYLVYFYSVLFTLLFRRQKSIL